MKSKEMEMSESNSYCAQPANGHLCNPQSAKSLRSWCDYTRLLGITLVFGFVALISCSVFFQVSNTVEKVDQTVTGTDFKFQKDLYPEATIIIANYVEWEHFKKTGNFTAIGNVFNNCSFSEKMRTFDYDEGLWNDTYLFKSFWGSFAVVGTPRKWGNGYSVHIECQHEEKIFFSFAVVSKGFNSVMELLHERQPTFDYDHENDSTSGAARFFLDLTKVEFQYIDSGTRSKVLLLRRETWEQNQLQRVEIKSQISVASNNPTDQQERFYFTKIRFTWANGEVYTLEKFQNGSYLSLIVLFCTVILALERTIAFIKRTKKRTKKIQRRKSIVK